MIAKIMSYATGMKLLILQHDEVFNFAPQGLVVNPSVYTEIMPCTDVALPLFRTTFTDRYIANYEDVLEQIPDSLTHVGGILHEFDWREGVDVEKIDCSVIADYFSAGSSESAIRRFINEWKVKDVMKTIDYDPVYYAPLFRAHLRRMIALASRLDSTLMRNLSSLRAVFDNGVQGPVEKFISLETYKRLVDTYLDADGRYPKWLIRMLLHEATIFLGANRETGDAYLRIKAS